jgi:hypothetical protein
LLESAALLYPKEVTSIENEGRFLTTGVSLPPFGFSASPGWLILSAAWGGVSKLLALCWENQIRGGHSFCQRTHLHGFYH